MLLKDAVGIADGAKVGSLLGTDDFEEGDKVGSEDGFTDIEGDTLLVQMTARLIRKGSSKALNSAHQSLDCRTSCRLSRCRLRCWT